MKPGIHSDFSNNHVTLYSTVTMPGFKRIYTTFKTLEAAQLAHNEQLALPENKAYIKNLKHRNLNISTDETELTWTNKNGIAMRQTVDGVVSKFLGKLYIFSLT